MRAKDAEGTANSVDHDQTAVWSMVTICVFSEVHFGEKLHDKRKLSLFNLYG